MRTVKNVPLTDLSGCNKLHLAMKLFTQVAGEKRSKHEEKMAAFAYRERRFGSFSRSVRLPFEADKFRPIRCARRNALRRLQSCCLPN